MTREFFEHEASRLRPLLLRAATTLTGNDDDAADIAQEVLLKLWFLRERLTEYRSIDAFARIITRNLCLNYIRDRHLVCTDVTQLLNIAADDTDAEISDDLLLAIESLPDTEQAVLRLKHIDGMENEEIAKLIQSTPGAVRTALSRARKHIREIFINNSNRYGR